MVLSTSRPRLSISFTISYLLLLGGVCLSGLNGGGHGTKPARPSFRSHTRCRTQVLPALGQTELTKSSMTAPAPPGALTQPLCSPALRPQATWLLEYSPQGCSWLLCASKKSHLLCEAGVIRLSASLPKACAGNLQKSGSLLFCTPEILQPFGSQSEFSHCPNLSLNMRPEPGHCVALFLRTSPFR